MNAVCDTSQATTVHLRGQLVFGGGGGSQLLLLARPLLLLALHPLLQVGQQALRR